MKHKETTVKISDILTAGVEAKRLIDEGLLKAQQSLQVQAEHDTNAVVDADLANEATARSSAMVKTAIDCFSQAAARCSSVTSIEADAKPEAEVKPPAEPAPTASGAAASTSSPDAGTTEAPAAETPNP